MLCSCEKSRNHRDNDGVIDIGNHTKLFIIANHAQRDINRFCCAHSPQNTIIVSTVNAEQLAARAELTVAKLRQMEKLLALLQTKFCDITGVQGLNRSSMPSRRQTVSLKVNIDVSAAVTESKSLRLTKSHDNRLTGDLCIEKLTPAATLAEP